jgi:hypothetical protein
MESKQLRTTINLMNKKGDIMFPFLVAAVIGIKTSALYFSISKSIARNPSRQADIGNHPVICFLKIQQEV